MPRCPNPRCNRIMSFHGYRGSTRLYKCGACGATAAEISSNSDFRTKGFYATTETLKQIQPNYYNRWLVVLMVGLACASFAFLQGSDWGAFFISFLASSTAMFVRQELAKRRFVMIITFGITAFTATMISSLSQLNGISETPNIALASSVLLLAPGFSFVNSFLDSLKGYLMMYLMRCV